MSKYVFQTSRPGHNDPSCSPSESACSCSHFCHALLPEPQWLKNLMQCWRSSAVQSEAWLPVLLQTAQSTICCHGSAVWRWLKHCWRYPAIFRNQLTSTTYLSNDPLLGQPKYKNTILKLIKLLILKPIRNLNN